MFDKDYAIEKAIEAIESCKTIHTRDGYGYPYVHYMFDEHKIKEALEVLKNIKHTHD